MQERGYHTITLLVIFTVLSLSHAPFGLGDICGVHASSTSLFSAWCLRLGLKCPFKESTTNDIVWKPVGHA